MEMFNKFTYFSKESSQPNFSFANAIDCYELSHSLSNQNCYALKHVFSLRENRIFYFVVVLIDAYFESKILVFILFFCLLIQTALI